jgi:hypothetical protein
MQCAGAIKKKAGKIHLGNLHFIAEANAKLFFTKDSDGNFLSFELVQNGQTFFFKRIP